MSESIKNKLSDFKAMPPEGCWDRISNALDEGTAGLKERLYHYHIPPPPSAWNRIASYLDSGKLNGKVVPMFLRYQKTMRYAGMAAVIIALVVFAWPYFSRVDDQTPVPDSITSTPLTRLPSNNNTPAEAETENTENISNSVKKEYTTIAKNRKPAERNEEDHEEPEIIAMLDYVPSAPVENEILLQTTPFDKYMIYTDEDGHAMKMSKKLFEVFDCATKEIACRQKIRDLQNRFASSAVSSDFTGLLEILRNLQENQ